jgi:hypothetical protein
MADAAARHGGAEGGRHVVLGEQFAEAAGAVPAGEGEGH